MKKLRGTVIFILMTVLISTRVYASTHIPILLYHNVLESYPDSEAIITITPSELENHLNALLSEGYNPISFEEYLNASQGLSALPENPVIITFDDGYETNYTYAYPIFKKLNVKATFFVVADTMGKTPGVYRHFTWEQAKEMHDSGVISIQSHTYSHRNMTELDLYNAERELRYSKYLIEKNLGSECDIVAFPFGYHNPDLVERAHNAGYKLVTQVGNYGTNTVNDADKALVRITIHGSWSSEKLLEIIKDYQR